MRQDQVLRRAHGLRFGRQCGPMGVSGTVGQDLIAIGQKVDINHPRPPADLPHPAHADLYLVQPVQHL